MPNTVFVFPDNDASGVLAAYGELVMKHLPTNQERKHGVHAIGAVHRLKDGKEQHYPKALVHYWDSYRSDLTATTFKPTKFVEEVHLARAHLATTGNGHESVEMVATCLLQLADYGDFEKPLQPRGKRHRFIEQALSYQPKLLALYRRFVYRYLFNPQALLEEEWTEKHPRPLRGLVAGLHHSQDMQLSSDGTDYLAWSEPSAIGDYHRQLHCGGINTYRFTQDNQHVDIQLASIHSVKGRTHSATLILETFSRKHFLEMMMPWLEGKPL